MGFFDRATKAPPPKPVVKPIPGKLHSVNGAGGKPVAQRPAPALAVAPASASLIADVADFPTYSELLSGVDSSTPELRVPALLQDKLLALRLTTTRAAVAYDPAATAEVKSYLITFRGALSGMGMSVETLQVRADVLASIRKSASTRGTEGRGNGASRSDGVRMFREWVQAAKDIGATDLHIRIMDSSRGEVTVRVDGEMEPIPGSKTGIFTSTDVKTAMVAAYEQLADKHSNSAGTFSDATSMSCMIDSALEIPNLRLRFSSQRGFFGPKAVVRLLPSEISAEPMPFSAMGFSPRQISLLEKAQRMESGVVLQMGVTGSGKTTVAKTFMEGHPRNGRLAMFQVADPIEYMLNNVHQIYVQRDLMTLSEAGKKDPYSEVIESLMRMDPDVVDVGEVRDFISARALANVGKSGHLAMGTLHADSLGGAVNRLTDPKLGLTRQELTSGNLLGFLSYQALVPCLCNNCKMDSADEVLGFLSNHEHPAERSEGRYLASVLKTAETRLGIDPSVFRFRNPEGCQVCRNRGTKGLTIVSEMMMPEDTWLDFAAEGKDREAMRWWRRTYNDKDFASENTDGKLVIEHTLYKAIHGMTDPRSIERFGQLDALEVLK